MKTYHRLASVILFIIYAALVVMGSGCVAGSSRTVNVGGVPGADPGPTLPKMVEPVAFDRSKDSYQIYSAILNHKWDKGNIVVRGNTDRGLFQNDDWLETNVGKSCPEAVNDFKTANDKDSPLENHFDYNGKISLIAQQQVK